MNLLITENSMLELDEKGRLTPFVRVLVENALSENADFGRMTPTVEELVKKTIEDGRASAHREIKVLDFKVGYCLESKLWIETSLS